MVFWRASSKKKKKSLKTILYAIVCISKMNSNLYGRNKNDPLCLALVLVQLWVNGYFLRIPHEACYKWIWKYLLRSRPLYEFNKDRCFVLFIDRNMQARESGLLGWSEKGNILHEWNTDGWFQTSRPLADFCNHITRNCMQAIALPKWKVLWRK